MQRKQVHIIFLTLLMAQISQEKKRKLFYTIKIPWLDAETRQSLFLGLT